MKFLVDEQLPPALAVWLAEAGHPAEHVSWRALSRASDDAIWREAFAIGAAIISKDEDFARRRMLETDGPSVVWVRLGNSRNTTLIHAFAVAMPQVAQAPANGEVLVELC